jgi:deoxyribonuclease-4
MAASESHGRRIGFHVSVAGGLPKAIRRALERGCSAFQVFCGSPRSWRFQERSDEEVAAFRAACTAVNLTPLAVHSCYLVNPCSGDRATLHRSILRLRAELRLAAEMGADYYVLHPGTRKGAPADAVVESAAQSIAEAINRAERTPVILLENTASTHGPGADFETLAQTLSRLKALAPSADAGVAVDSCHAFAAGYDFRRAEEVSRLVADLERTVGLQSVRLLHANDSRDPCGSRRDRHYHIGKGTIGREGLSALFNCRPLAGLPLILETPWESAEVDRRNMRAMLDLLQAPPPREPAAGRGPQARDPERAPGYEARRAIPG